MDVTECRDRAGLCDEMHPERDTLQKPDDEKSRRITARLFSGKTTGRIATRQPQRRGVESFEAVGYTGVRTTASPPARRR
jgi:hypothetical protein